MKLRTITTMAISAAVLISCSDWTTPESITIEVSSLEKDNPEVYAEYCKSIRDYKASDHKLVYVSFDNHAKTDDQSYNLTSLPDSVDVVEISNPDEIDANLVAQMNKLRADKGFRFAVEFSFSAVKEDFEAKTKDLFDKYMAERDTVAAHGGDPETVVEPEYPTLDSFLTPALENVFESVDNYNFDIVRVEYSDVKSRAHLTTEEDSAYVADQTDIFNKILKEFKSRSSVKMFLNSRAEYIVSEDIINAAEYIILPTESLFGTSELDYMAVRTIAQYPGVKLLYAISSASDDFSEGWFNNKTVEQIPIAALWINEQSEFDKSGLVIYNVRRTFFDTNRNVYNRLRSAIKVMNPNS